MVSAHHGVDYSWGNSSQRQFSVMTINRMAPIHPGLNSFKAQYLAASTNRYNLSRRQFVVSVSRHGVYSKHR